MNLDYINQFVELFIDLLDNELISFCDQRYPGYKGVHGRSDTKALYIVATTAKHPSNAGKHAWLIVH
ncbi:hypothetical protein ES703_81007 [subsurface metagenome]